MQSESSFIRRTIVKLSRRKASICSQTRSNKFCQKTKNTVLPLQKFTIKSKDRAKLLSKLTSVYKSYKARKARRRIGKCKRGLAVQLQVLQLQSKQQKQTAHPLKKRIPRPQTNCEFKEIIVGCRNSRQTRTIFSRRDSISTGLGSGRQFWGIPISNFKTEERRTLSRKGLEWKCSYSLT